MASNEMALSHQIERNLRRQMDVLLYPKQLRALFSRAMGALPTPEDVRFEPVMAGEVPVEWMIPEGVPEDKTLMHLHGGGYMIGSPIDYREMVPRMARAAGAKGLVPDYRTSPEHKCPAARDDCVAAYRWHLENGGSPERTVITGDSAGGGLVLTTLVALREQGNPLPAAAVCISPWAELEMLGGSIETNADKDPFLDKSLLVKMAEAYLSH
jgi:monoterpene epsilon-lactone hydrolase